MKQETLKSYLIRDKGFLKELYETTNILKTNRILSNSNDTQLNTFIMYCHFLTKGEIKISKNNFDVLKKSKKIKFMQQHVESKNDVLELINGERIKKKNFIRKLNNALPNILYGLFNLE